MLFSQRLVKPKLARMRDIAKHALLPRRVFRQYHPHFGKIRSTQVGADIDAVQFGETRTGHSDARAGADPTLTVLHHTEPPSPLSYGRRWRPQVGGVVMWVDLATWVVSEAQCQGTE
jgi:hypothetical protein